MKRLFISLPNLDGLAWSDRGNRPPRRKLPSETRRLLELQRRALICLPYRELSMLFQCHVLRLLQDEITPLYDIRQSNVSYSIENAKRRIKLHVELAEICSETQIYRQLTALAKGKGHKCLTPQEVSTVLGVCKTSAQSRTALSFGRQQAQVRLVWNRALKLLEQAQQEEPSSERDRVITYMYTIACNWNILSKMRTQQRYEHKTKPKRPLIPIQ